MACSGPFPCWPRERGVVAPHRLVVLAAVLVLGVFRPGGPVLVSAATFSTCDVFGPTGPSQENCDTSYGAPGLVTVTEGLQSYTIPTTGEYNIVAAGARGGKLYADSDFEGHGAIVSGDFALQQGDVLTALVGQVPVDRTDAACRSLVGSPGGGGSYVVLQTATGSYTMSVGGLAGVKVSPLVVAGGGGGVIDSACQGTGNVSPGHARGFEGSPTVSSPSNHPVSGSSFAADGSGGSVCATDGSAVSQSFLSGGQGHGACSSYLEAGGGGFGGGGTPWDGGGGGGGWQGGEAHNSQNGIGGSSYISPLASGVQLIAFNSNPGSMNEGAGYVLVTNKDSGCSADGDWPPTPASTDASIACAEGYTGTRTRACGIGGAWAAPDETCAPRTCPPLAAPAKGLYDGEAVLSSGVYGTVATLSCGLSASDLPSILGSGASMTCNAQGAWESASAIPSTCAGAQTIGVQIQHDHGALVFGTAGTSSSIFPTEDARELAVSGSFKVHGKLAVEGTLAVGGEIEDLVETIRALTSRLDALEAAL